MEAWKLGTGTWRLNACPMDGGDLAVAEDGSLTTVWRRDKTLYTTGGEKSNEVMLALGEQPCVAIGKKGGYLAWVERRGGALRFSQLGSNKSAVLDNEASDPSVGISHEPDKPVVVVWESRNTSGTTIVASTIHE